MELFKACNITIERDGYPFVRSGSFKIMSGESVVIYSKYNESLLVLDALYRLFEVDSGEIYYVGQNISQFAREDIVEWKINDIQYVDSTNTLFTTMNVKDNILLPLTLNRKAIDDDYLNEMFKITQVDTLLNNKINELSLLEINKVKLARALSLKPFIILIKNITAILPEKERLDYLGILNQVNNILKTTIIHATNFENITNWGSRVIEIIEGELTEKAK